MKIFTFLFKLLIFLLVIITISSTVLFSNIGKKYIADMINKKLASTSNYSVRVENISLHFPLKLKIKYLTISDQTGEWLLINGFRISLLPTTALLNKQIIINKINASKVKFLRPPLTVVKLQKGTTNAPVDFAYDIIIHQLRVPQISVRHESKIYELSFDGQLNWQHQDSNIQLIASTQLINNVLPATNLDLQGIYNLQNNFIALDSFALTTVDFKAQGKAKLNFNDYSGIVNARIKSDNLHRFFDKIDGNIVSLVNVTFNKDTISCNSTITSDLNYDDKQVMHNQTGVFELDYDHSTHLGKLMVEFKDLLSANVDFNYMPELLELSQIKIHDNNKNVLAGQLAINLQSKRLTGNVKLNARNLSGFHPSFSNPYNAILLLNINKENKQLFNLSIKGNKSHKDSTALLNLESKGSLDYQTADYFKVQLSKLNFAYNNAKIKNTKPLSIEYKNEHLQFDFSKIALEQGSLDLQGQIVKNNISAQLVLNSRLNNFFTLLLPSRHKLQGDISSKIQIQGTTDNPNFNGRIEIKNSKYKDLKSGIEIKNIIAGINIRNSQLYSDNCKLYDIKGSAASCNLKADFQDGNSNFSFNINANNFYLLIPSMGAQTKLSADLLFSGNEKQSTCNGNVNINSLDITIPEHFGPSVPELNIVAKNNIAKTHRKNNYPLLLNVNIIANNKFFVRGWGLDIELKGALKLINPHDHFTINGKLSTIRGRYQEFGKYFEIKKGDLLFEGEIPPSPYLDIIGVTTQGDTQISLELAGPLLKPLLSIYSNPPLSQEEALSLVLFGKKSDNITAFQAISLANSLQKFSGYGDNKLEILGKLRKVLKVDDISISTDEDSNKAKIGVGKYLSDKLYLKIEAGAEDTKTSVEYELKPNITLEGIMGGNDNTVRINWKKDY